MSSLVHLAVPFFIALLVLESIVAAHRGRKVFSGRDTATSLALGFGSVLVGLAWKGVAFGAYTALHTFAPVKLEASAATWALLIVADDFCYYWFHRLHHEVRVFWASHVPHHSSQRYNLSTALRQSWTPPTSLVFYAPLPLLGFDPLMIVTAHSINLLYQFWIHTELIDRLGPVEWVMNTPSHHRVHHGANVKYLDRNYAGIFIVWDRLFGTFEPEDEPVRFGLTKNIDTFDPFRVAFHEWFAVLRAASRPAPWRVRLAWLVKPPGWSPDGSTQTAAEMRRAVASDRIIPPGPDAWDVA